MTVDKCCNHNCAQGDTCPQRKRAANLARPLIGHAVFLLCLMSAASAIAVWLAKWGTT